MGKTLRHLLGDAFAECPTRIVGLAVGHASSCVGNTGQVSALFFGLSPSTDWQTDIDVKMIGTDESVLGHVILPSARFAQNLTSIYSGGIIGAGKNFTITVDDTWEDDDIHTW